ncbi:MAG: cytochrome c oxidase subunit II [Bacteroidetes bacterium]|nr:cytochrome c oxidase subunit II [Bacteroidota bacterium]
MRSRLHSVGRWAAPPAFAVLLLLAAGTRAGAGPVADSSSHGHRWWLPAASTAVAGRIDSLFILILWITSAFLVLVVALFVAFVIRYRHREGRRAAHVTGNMLLEIVWMAVPAACLIAIAYASNGAWSAMKEEFPRESESLVIIVKPRQFQWDVVYAGADGRFETADDITAINRLDVPAGRNVIVKLMAQDVIHSFFVPQFRMKQDAVPGMTTEMWFNVPAPGTFEIACAELCGLGHYRMQGRLIVHAPAEYDAWYAGRLREKAAESANAR